MIDWLRDGLGATAIASIQPARARRRDRARHQPRGMTSITSWTQRSSRSETPERLTGLRGDPWTGIRSRRRGGPDLADKPREASQSGPRKGRSVIVSAAKPKRRRSTVSQH